MCTNFIISSIVLLIHNNSLNSASSESSTLAAEVISTYEITASAIDNLLGIDSSPQEQLDQLVNYSNEYKIIKERVLKLEEDLVSLHTDINQRVNEVRFDSNFRSVSDLYCMFLLLLVIRTPIG